MTGLILIGVVAAIVVGGVAYFLYQAEQKRLKELEAWALAHGCRLDRGSEYGAQDRLPAIKQLRQGSNRYGKNFIRGIRNGRPIEIFEHHHETTSTDSKGRTQTHHHWQTVVVIDTGWSLQPLAIRKEHFFDRIAEFVGWDDIDFESAEFSRAFHVSSPDRKFAYDVIDQAMMEYLLGALKRPIGMGDTILFTVDSGYWSPEKIDPAIELLEGMLERWPRSLARELSERAT